MSEELHQSLTLDAGVGSVGRPLSAPSCQVGLQRHRDGRAGSEQPAVLFGKSFFRLQVAWRGLEGAASFLQGNGVNVQTPTLANTSNSGQLERIMENQRIRVPHEGVRGGVTALLRHSVCAAFVILARLTCGLLRD